MVGPRLKKKGLTHDIVNPPTLYRPQLVFVTIADLKSPKRKAIASNKT
ncbi:hypothetical protein [[Limnothrix rosea] IAM M-220]|nr:hypothetical protein [[Limnothrix rosea] IAM M-220]